MQTATIIFSNPGTIRRTNENANRKIELNEPSKKTIKEQAIYLSEPIGRAKVLADKKLTEQENTNDK